MTPFSSFRARGALATVCVVILFGATGCSFSVGFGTSDSPVAEASTPVAAPSSAAPSITNTATATAAASAICTDLSTEDQVDVNDVNASMAYWDQVVADSPSDIVDQAQAVEDGFRKIADGMDPNDEENNNAINDAIAAIESWWADNCT